MSAKSERLKNQLLINNATAIEKFTPAFKRPELRLRFIQSISAIGNKHQENIGQAFKKFPAPVQKRFSQWILNLKMRKTICDFIEKEDSLSNLERQAFLRQAKLPLFGSFIINLYDKKLLNAFALGLTISVLVSGFLLSFVLVTYIRTTLPQTITNQTTQSQRQTQTPNTNLSDLPTSEKVWSVETQSNFERYSNGLRVDTTYSTNTRSRKFQLYDRNLEKPSTDNFDKPIGILYHSTESDLVAFAPTNTSSIEAVSKETLQYVQRHQSYNYFIDRFGQVYRIVPDEQVSYHAGRSLWADEKGIIIELNESFIGVSFETKSADKTGGQLTEAQLISGRLLTGTIRSRYNIPDANCVTHGLASVNPDNGVIAYHYDWLKGFPFKAIGITDKYDQPPPSIAELGFIYDSDTVNKLGGTILPGLPKAAAAFKERATKENTTTENLRNRLRQRYINIMNGIREANK